MLLCILLTLIISTTSHSSHKPKPLTRAERNTVALYQQMLELDYHANQNKRSHTITNAIGKEKPTDAQRFIEVLRWYNFPHLRRNDPQTHQALQEKLFQARTNNKIWQTILRQLPTIREPSYQEQEPPTRPIMRTTTMAKIKLDRARTDKKPRDMPTSQPIPLPSHIATTDPKENPQQYAQQHFMLAIKHNDISGCKRWLECGAQVDKCIKGEIPIQAAIVAGHPQMVEYLLTQGAQVTAHQRTLPKLYAQLIMTQSKKTMSESLKNNFLERYFDIHRMLNPLSTTA